MYVYMCMYDNKTTFDLTVVAERAKTSAYLVQRPLGFDPPVHVDFQAYEARFIRIVRRGGSCSPSRTPEGIGT
jgi:hypothetical protein